MKRVFSLLLVVVLVLSFFVAPVKTVKAVVPATVNYQGRLSDATNAPLSGQYDFRFRLYDDAAKTTLLWGPEEHLNQTVSNGYFDLPLGSITTFASAGLDFTDQYWLTLEIKENTAGTWDTETDPPVSFNAYAYALNAEKVDSATGLVNVGNTIQGGAALVGAETAFSLDTGAGFTGDLLSLSNNGTNYLTIDSAGDAAFTGTSRISMENNTVNDLIGLKIIQTNDVGNYSGSILELKGSGPDYTNNVYFGKYGDGFWVTDWAGNGVLATDQDLILGSMGATDAINPNPDPRILFQVGGGYSTPITTAILESDNFNFLPYDTVAGSTVSMRFSELAANGSNYVGFKAPDLLAGDQIWTLPIADGANGEVLNTDGAGNLSWGSAAAPSVANGIVDNAGVLELGGSLNKNTNIDLNTFGLQFDSSNGYFKTTDDRTEFMYGDTYFTAEEPGFEMEAADVNSVTNLYIRPDQFQFSNYDPNTGLPVATFHGLTYDVDYSANYTDRSLVDKAYVDSVSHDLLFKKTGNLIINNAVDADVTTDDFLFGSDTMDYGTEANRMFFDKSKASFRAGQAGGTEWDTANVGDYSAAFGRGSKASGFASFVAGQFSEATNFGSIVIGNSAHATGSSAVVIGGGNAYGNNSIAMGSALNAESYREIAMGSYPTTYVPASLTAWDDADRMFVIGNGADSSNRLNALEILKGGQFTINAPVNEALLVNQPTGTNSLAIATTGYVDSKVGSSIFDTDIDTGIQVERTADDDNIYFQSAGQDIMRLVNAGGINKNIYIGDFLGDGNETKLEISDAGQAINFNGLSANFGDIEGNQNEVMLIVDDTNQMVQAYQANLSVSPASGAVGTGEFRILENPDNGLNYVGFKSVDSLAADQIWTLPAVDGSNGQVLKTDGSGSLSWGTVSGGGGVSSVILSTSTTTGSFSSGGFVGYEAGNDICNAEFAGSHFCRTDEIIEYIAGNSAAAFTNSTTAWVAEGPPGYTSNSNDCAGWTDSNNTKLGAFWAFDTTGGGMGWLTNCAVTKPVACCQ